MNLNDMYDMYDVWYVYDMYLICMGRDKIIITIAKWSNDPRLHQAIPMEDGEVPGVHRTSLQAGLSKTGLFWLEPESILKFTGEPSYLYHQHVY